jgi:hypothetical protein
VRLVEAAPALFDLFCGGAGRLGGLGGRRRSAELDEETVGRVPEVDVRLIHG